MPAAEVIPNTLILHDGGPLALLAVAITREAAALAGGANPGQPPARVAAIMFPSVVRSQASMQRHCEAMGIDVLEITPLALSTLPPVSREAHELLHAATFAAFQRFERVIWPVSAAIGDHLDLDRISAIVDRALLISRLVALDSRDHGTPGIRIETPYADFTDRQVADLAADMELPVEACWWWGHDDPEAAQERERWMSAMQTVGWRPR